MANQEELRPDEEECLNYVFSLYRRQHLPASLKPRDGALRPEDYLEQGTFSLPSRVKLLIAKFEDELTSGWVRGSEWLWLSAGSRFVLLNPNSVVIEVTVDRPVISAMQYDNFMILSHEQLLSVIRVEGETARVERTLQVGTTITAMSHKYFGCGDGSLFKVELGPAGNLLKWESFSEIDSAPVIQVVATPNFVYSLHSNSQVIAYTKDGQKLRVIEYERDLVELLPDGDDVVGIFNDGGIVLIVPFPSDRVIDLPKGDTFAIPIPKDRVFSYATVDDGFLKVFTAAKGTGSLMAVSATDQYSLSPSCLRGNYHEIAFRTEEKKSSQQITFNGISTAENIRIECRAGIISEADLSRLPRTPGPKQQDFFKQSENRMEISVPSDTGIGCFLETVNKNGNSTIQSLSPIERGGSQSTTKKLLLGDNGHAKKLIISEKEKVVMNPSFTAVVMAGSQLFTPVLKVKTEVSKRKCLILDLDPVEIGYPDRVTSSTPAKSRRVISLSCGNILPESIRLEKSVMSIWSPAGIHLVCNLVNRGIEKMVITPMIASSQIQMTLYETIHALGLVDRGILICSSTNLITIRMKPIQEMPNQAGKCASLVRMVRDNLQNPHHDVEISQGDWDSVDFVEAISGKQKLQVEPKAIMSALQETYKDSRARKASVREFEALLTEHFLEKRVVKRIKHSLTQGSESPSSRRQSLRATGISVSGRGKFLRSGPESATLGAAADQSQLDDLVPLVYQKDASENPKKVLLEWKKRFSEKFETKNDVEADFLLPFITLFNEWVVNVMERHPPEPDVLSEICKFKRQLELFLTVPRVSWDFVLLLRPNNAPFACLFSPLTDNQLEDVVKSIVDLTFKDKEVILNGKADHIYIINTGKCQVFKSDTHIATLSRGQYFGELERDLFVVADGQVRCWSIHRSLYMKLIHDWQLQKRQLYKDQLKSLSFLSPLNDEEIDRVVDVLRPVDPVENTELVSQGGDADDFYIILEGECVVTKQESDGQNPREIARLHSGDYFGETALLSNTTQPTTVTAGAHCKLVKLDIMAFKTLLTPCWQLFMERMKQRNDGEKLARDVAQLKTETLAASKISVRKEFTYHDSNRLDGIIAHLTRECGQNVHAKGIVNVRMSSVPNNSRLPENVVDFASDSGCLSKSEPNSWLCFDFKDRRVIPTSYSVKTCRGGPGEQHLKSWVIEVSNDGYSWTEIDRREANKELNDDRVTRNFEICRVSGESFRFFRLRQIGKNHGGNYSINLTALEIFGTLC